MCEICRSAGLSRRNFLRTALGGTAAAAFLPGFLAKPAAAAELPAGVGEPGRRTLIRGGHVMSMDPAVGDFASGDVLLEGDRIVEVGQSIDAPDAEVIDAEGRIVMPGFVDTHHHQFETSLRSYLPNGIMFADPTRPGEPNYLDDILGKFSRVYRPEDVYIAQLFGGLSQLDAGVTTVLDVSQIHHSPEHSDAVIEGMKAVGRRGVFGYFEGYGPDLQYPQDARRIRDEHFASDDQLLTMLMGGEVYLPGVDPMELWNLGKELDLMIGLHVVGSLGMQETMDSLIPHYTDKHLFIHMTGMSDAAWNRAQEVGAHVSLSVPIEMQMRHGMPPIQKALDMGMQPSLSVDVECTMTADFFTQMRGAITLQRALANQQALERGPESAPTLLSSRDVLEMATVNGAKGLKLDHKTGSLTPGKQADVILLSADALNVAPLNNVPGAVVTLMDRSNVETVMVAGQIRKWQGAMVGHDIAALTDRITASRDYLFEAADTEVPLFD
ncbi:amidohydrolase family protein [Allosediminivita pacifica]|uniref:Cytosine/adenosine deaminase-related metal-dependent hydrolase n=1 Tax=Allosediminivita pacifica TaxID=1267769 RepID=A0A2T6B9K9_9RHOB|nr:amidohydrolase family protein [Allosediminivita pacifica]PTX52744.1 cytosine/adenosine deaminase-related metal-dependent hydrolase [Allosediminivita pacifica]GGA96204.1 cytosine deaminase [Allosediminivita pacifica]